MLSPNELLSFIRVYNVNVQAVTLAFSVVALATLVTLAFSVVTLATSVTLAFAVVAFFGSQSTMLGR